MKDLIVDLEGRPHGLAAFAEILATAGINIEGMCGLYANGVGIDHVLVEDAEAPRHVLAAAGFETGAEREVLVVELEDRPGALAEVARRVADAGVDVDLIYLASGPGSCWASTTSRLRGPRSARGCARRRGRATRGRAPTARAARSRPGGLTS